MSAPGWYPDPSGRPGHRWWDGGRWTDQTSAAPGRAPAGGTGGGRGRAGVVVVLVAVLAALGLVAVLVVPRLVGGGREVVDPGPRPRSTVSAWDETTRPSPTPPPASPTPSAGGGTPTAGGMVSCPSGDPAARQDHPEDGRLHGGGLSVARVPGWSDYGAYGYSWGYDLAGQSDRVTDGWIALTAVGAIGIADGFQTPEQSAVDMMSCLATSDYYGTITGREDVVSEAVTVDGRPGWWLRSEVTVADREVAGDVVDVVVLDTGGGESLSFFSACAPLGDTGRIALIDDARASLRVG